MSPDLRLWSGRITFRGSIASLSQAHLCSRSAQQLGDFTHHGFGGIIMAPVGSAVVELAGFRCLEQPRHFWSRSGKGCAA